jgi:hypothetical protein
MHAKKETGNACQIVSGSARASDFGRASHQTGAEGYTTMFEWRLRERNRRHVVSREGSVSC